ncbi:MAG TPA: MFS transporter [Rhizomicrobium sp.]|jgi:predicted MFS family arabinose efflux permease|nr:MFS transporter [Rhizomicrobium sp.]
MADITAATDVAETPATPAPITGLRHRYILLMLLGAYTLSFLDRQVVTILAESIKKDLHITNLELGMLSGLAFALFYTFLGIPIARLAETRSRPLIIAGAMALWSGFTVLSGRATSFGMMAIARLGVGFGEAGCNPCAHSMIADITPPEKRASALAFYSLGVPIGSMLGLILGGVIADAYGWRFAFFVAGAPGLLLAIVIALTIKEPRSHIAAHLQARAVSAPSFSATLKELRGKRTFWLVAVAAGLMAFVGYGQAAFSAPFFLRVHGAEVADLATRVGLGPQGFLGIASALTGGIGGIIGTWLGGFLADRAAVRDKRSYMSVPAIAGLISMPFIFAVYLVPSVPLALSIGFIPTLLNTLWYGPVYATAQSVVAPQSRATAAAVLLFVLNLIGLGFGPMSVGALNDILAAQMGEVEGIRWAMLLASVVVLISVALFWWARKTVREDIVS